MGVRLNAHSSFTGPLQVMVIEKFIELVIDRMSAEDKERIVETAINKFFAGMTTEEKQQFVEKLIRRLLEEVDVKIVFPQIMAMLRKEAEDSALIGKMGKAATQTGGIISDVVANFVKGTRREE